MTAARDGATVSYMKLSRGLGALGATVVLGLTAAAPTPATAADQLTCAGSQTSAYAPGLQLLTTQTVTATVNTHYGTCASVTDPTIHSASPTLVQRQATLSCVALLSSAPSPGTIVYRWDNGQTSTFQYSNSLTQAAGLLTVTATGSIVSGEFAGASAVAVAEDVALPTDCLSAGGLTSQTGEITLTIAGA